MQMYRKTLAAVLMAVMSLPIQAQSEAGLIVSAEAEKKIDKKLGVSLEADMRTRNDFKTMDRCVQVQQVAEGRRRLQAARLQHARKNQLQDHGSL